MKKDFQLLKENSERRTLQDSEIEREDLAAEILVPVYNQSGYKSALGHSSNPAIMPIHFS